jgi:hypothetical protein
MIKRQKAELAFGDYPDDVWTITKHTDTTVDWLFDKEVFKVCPTKCIVRTCKGKYTV